MHATLRLSLGSFAMEAALGACHKGKAPAAAGPTEAPVDTPIAAAPAAPVTSFLALLAYALNPDQTVTNAKDKFLIDYFFGGVGGGGNCDSAMTTRLANEVFKDGGTVVELAAAALSAKAKDEVKGDFTYAAFVRAVSGDSASRWR